jgi:hypothetical protein
MRYYEIKEAVEPNFNFEWSEARRYPEFRKIGKSAWIDLVKKGKAVTIKSAKGINNTNAADPDSFKSLEKDKQERALSQLSSGNVEMPIIAIYSDGWKELIGGNTRLTAMLSKNKKATVWIFKVPDEVAELAEDVYDNIKEARRNPDHPAQQKKSTMDELKKYLGKDYYISFTDLPKAGINPTSKWKTPIGFYVYPLRFFKDIKHVSAFPFASDRPFIQVVKAKGKPLQNVRTYSSTQLNSDIRKIASMVNMKGSEINEMLDNNEIPEWTDFYDKPIGDLWRVTKYFAESGNAKLSVEWNTILRKLGYSGFIDDGLGVIHENEPKQAFFLSSNYFESVDVIRNEGGTNLSLYYSKMKQDSPEMKRINRILNDNKKSPMLRAMLLKDTPFKYSIDKMKVPVEVKALLPTLRLPIDSLPYDIFTDTVDDLIEGEIDQNILMTFLLHIENLTKEQYQYVLDKNMNIPIKRELSKYIDELNFHSGMYDNVVKTSMLSDEDKYKIIGDKLLSDSRYFVIALRSNMSVKFLYENLTKIDTDMAPTVLKTIMTKIYNHYSEFDKEVVDYLEDAVEIYKENYGVSDTARTNDLEGMLQFMKKRIKTDGET